MGRDLFEGRKSQYNRILLDDGKCDYFGGIVHDIGDICTIQTDLDGNWNIVNGMFSNDSSNLYNQ